MPTVLEKLEEKYKNFGNFLKTELKVPEEELQKLLPNLSILPTLITTEILPYIKEIEEGKLPPIIQEIVDKLEIDIKQKDPKVYDKFLRYLKLFCALLEVIE